MPTVHFLNVCEGDCSIIQHGSGHFSVIDVCNGNAASQPMTARGLADFLMEAAQRSGSVRGMSGNYGMKDSPTDPVAYMKSIGITNVFRFILTHPDMDHLDGFKELCDEIGITNFWDSGVRRPKPDFSGGQYEEADWDHYVKVRDGKTEVTVVTPKAGSTFQFANLGGTDNNGDYLSVISPTMHLMTAANDSGDPNDASYVVVYRTCGGRIIFPGDAHDDTWASVLENHKDLVKDCAVLIAPHHGRDSDRCYDFLDILNPGLTLFGCANSEHLAYDAWNSRNLLHITNNQAGNIILNATNEGIEVYVENQSFAENYKSYDETRRFNGCFFIGQVPKP